MGKTLTAIGFWDTTMKIKEVIEASQLKYFKLKSLKTLSNVRYSLYECDDGTYTTRLPNNEFITFTV